MQQEVGIADLQKAGKQGTEIAKNSSVHISTLYISALPHIFNVDMYRVELCTELFYATFPPACCWSAISASCYIFNLVYVTLFLTEGICLSWSLLSVTQQQVCPHRIPQ